MQEAELVVVARVELEQIVGIRDMQAKGKGADQLDGESVAVPVE